MGVAEDKLDIMELMAKYAHAGDGLVPEDYADVFTEDGVANFVRSNREVRGRQELIEFAKGLVAGRAIYQWRHVQSNTLWLEVTPDRVKARTYIILTRNEPGKPITVMLTGYYEDDVVRTPKGWLFKERKFYADPPPEAKGEAQAPA